MTDSPLPTTGSIPVLRGALVAVVVTRGVTPYLATTLAGLAGQTRRPSRVLVVDAGPRDDAAPRTLPPDDPVAGLVRRMLDEVAPLDVLGVPGARTFGHAVRAALALPGTGATGPVEVSGPRPPVAADWLWLLHDDSAPAPTALEELVRAVEHAPSVGVAGAKQRSWDDPARLLEVGVTTSRLGRRMTGVEDGEVDQGQHDGREDVLAVGLAGALVRRDVWDELDGPDPALGPFGDGLDLSRRARLAGHRVVVVPRAVVHHARAAYAGLRDDDHAAADGDPGAADGSRPVAAGRTGARAAPAGRTGARSADPRRSYAARRRAHVHGRLAAVPLPLVPVLALGFLVAGVVRALLRVAGKDARLAAAELGAPLAALLAPGRTARSRAVARSTRRMPRRSLRALQTTWRDVYREQRDHALGRAEARRVVQAPSELELAELGALATRRRAGLAAVLLALVALTVAVLGSLVAAVAGGRVLVGGGLLPAGADLAELWRAATSGWTSGGLGVGAPGDPLLAVLLPVAALSGGSTQAAVHVLFLGGTLLAGLGAWFAAGAATRSVAVRLWAAVAWVGAPTLHAALDGGRLGAVLAHAALPWVALGVARAVGVQRLDVVVSGLVGARTAQTRHGAPADGPAAEAVDAVDAAGAVDAVVPVVSAPGPAPAASPAPVTPDGATPPRAATPTPPGRGSVAAAAAAGLAFAVAVAGAPVLLPAGLLVLLVVALVAPRGRHRLVLVVLPALALAGPLLVDAVARRDAGGWRTLLAEPGVPVPSSVAPAWQVLLGRPVPPSGGLAGALTGPVADALPFVLGGSVALLALLALLRGPRVSRGVRTGWVVAALGVTAAVVTGRVETAVAGAEVARGWPGAPVSLAFLGLLAAAVLGADGTRGRMAHRAFGWRQVTVTVLTVVAALAPLVPLAEWVARVRTDPAAGTPVLVSAVDGGVVPAVGQQAQTSPERTRVLTLAAEADGALRYGLLRDDGPQLTERSAAAAARTVRGLPGRAQPVAPDPATAEVERLVARLGSGATGDVDDDLGALAIGAVLVPPARGGDDLAARGELVGRLDATGGLERITEGPTGVIWRVVGPADGAAPGPAWARLVTPGDAGEAVTTPLTAGRLAARDVVPAGPTGRTLVLAERADPGWRAWLDGRPLPAVDAGWAQTFDVGTDGGRLTVAWAPAGRTAWLVVQGIVLALTVLLAVPVRRRRGGAR